MLLAFVSMSQSGRPGEQRAVDRVDDRLGTDLAATEKASV